MRSRLSDLMQNRVQRYNKKMKNTNNSVKKHQSYWVLLFAVLFSGALNAKVNNYVGAYANVGEWSLMPSGSKYSTSFGAAGGLGFLYELQAGSTYRPTRFLFNVGVGAQGGFTSFMQGANMEVRLEKQHDLNDDVFDYVYQVSNRHDDYTDIAVQVPLMIGLHHRKFYMLAGVKVGAHMWTRAHTTGTLRTYGDYLMFDDFESMPEYQFFDNLPLDKTSKASFNLTMDASFEIGGRLGFMTEAVGYDVPKRKIEYRLAGFVDYGLLDIHTDRGLDGFATPKAYVADEAYKSKTMVENLTVNDIMSTTGFAKAVNSLTFGLKFTVLFQLPEPGHCVICRDAYTSSARDRGGRRGMKYEE